jgi:hypothetical protein
MNPFTKFLRHRRGNGNFDRFVSYWDRLEWLTIQVYKEQVDASSSEVEAEFAQVWPWLRQNYGRWQDELKPCWRQTRAAEAPAKSDPFLLLLAADSPKSILGNWRAMQHLPAAREALNHYLLQQPSP